VANIEVEWVDSLSLHLEFDKSTKILKLFRLPSLCLLMCCCENESPLTQYVSHSVKSTSRWYAVLTLLGCFLIPFNRMTIHLSCSKTHPITTERSFSPIASFSVKTNHPTPISIDIAPFHKIRNTQIIYSLRYVVQTGKVPKQRRSTI
jgi:hypothetical protein